MTKLSSLLVQPLLGCNVYVSAGGLPRHASILRDLLKRTQERSRDSEKDDCVVVVHAFADKVYNRSSFHLAGTETGLPNVVSRLVEDAQQMLRQEATQSTGSSHPFVGLVDHISVMPLQVTTSVTATTNNTPWGRAARSIGESLTSTHVVYYGDADSHQTSLADVRRLKTNFFQSGGLGETTTSQLVDTCTVGAPSQFVENYNIRLSGCDKKTAQSLTKFVRERDGGLAGVEALTLPYGEGKYEVACNLTQPQVGSANAADKRVEEWMKTNMIPNNVLELSYRVGTTAEQCLEVLNKAMQQPNFWHEHNRNVQTTLEGYLKS